jgi:branched-chain amino acid aminotransferase
MIVFFNGQHIPEERALVSIFDRSFLYGDGLFETIRICQGKPFRWSQHIERLRRGAAFLKIQAPLPTEELQKHVQELVRRNAMPESVLRITLSRGIGHRGYSPAGADHPNLVMSLHPAPAPDPRHLPQWRLMISSLRVAANDPVAHHKTCNKLHQVLARAEADSQGADEALLLNTDGEVVEAASGNLFWIGDGVVHTPPLASGVLPGITREVVMEVCQSSGLACCEDRTRVSALHQAEAVFLTLTTLGVVEAVSLDGVVLKQSSLTGQIRDAYQELVEKEIKAS